MGVVGYACGGGTRYNERSMTIGVCIVTYRNAENIRRSWESWRMAGEKSEHSIRWSVLDSASPDDTGAQILQLQQEMPLPGMACVELSHSNNGFAGGINAAVSLLSLEEVDWLFFLNPDTILPDYFFQDLAARLSAAPNTVAAFAPAMRGEDGITQGSCGPKPSFMHEFMEVTELARMFGHGRWCRPNVQSDAPCFIAGEKGWLGGGALAVRTSVWQQIGPFDVGYYMYLEDIDWCLRAQSAGFVCWYDPSIVLTHIGQVSSGGSDVESALRRTRWIFASTRRLYRLHFSLFARFVLVPLAYLRLGVFWVRAKWFK